MGLAGFLPGVALIGAALAAASHDCPHVFCIAANGGNTSHDRCYSLVISLQRASRPRQLSLSKPLQISCGESSSTVDHSFGGYLAVEPPRSTWQTRIRPIYIPQPPPTTHPPRIPPIFLRTQTTLPQPRSLEKILQAGQTDVYLLLLTSKNQTTLR